MLLLAAAVGARRILEPTAEIRPPGRDERDTFVEGVRWRSREVEGAGGETVVYVHGFLSSSASWKRVLAPASARRPAVAVDLPGWGFSDRPWPYDYTVGGQALHLLRYLEERGVRRAVLVGNSLGGGVCLVAAAASPERVAALVLVDSVFPGQRIPPGFRTLRTPLLGELQLEFLIRPVMAYTLRHRLYAHAERVTEETIDDWWDPIPVPGTRRAALNAVRSRDRGLERILASIRLPTLVLWGKEDRLLPPSEGLRLASEIHDARFLALPGAGHLPQEEVPGEFARAVAGFLTELETGQSP